MSESSSVSLQTDQNTVIGAISKYLELLVKDKLPNNYFNSTIHKTEATNLSLLQTADRSNGNTASIMSQTPMLLIKVEPIFQEPFTGSGLGRANPILSPIMSDSAVFYSGYSSLYENVQTGFALKTDDIRKSINFKIRIKLDGGNAIYSIADTMKMQLAINYPFYCDDIPIKIPVPYHAMRRIAARLGTTDLPEIVEKLNESSLTPFMLVSNNASGKSSVAAILQRNFLFKFEDINGGHEREGKVIKYSAIDITGQCELSVPFYFLESYLEPAANLPELPELESDDDFIVNVSIKSLIDTDPDGFNLVHKQALIAPPTSTVDHTELGNYISGKLNVFLDYLYANKTETEFNETVKYVVMDDDGEFLTAGTDYEFDTDTKVLQLNNFTPYKFIEFGVYFSKEVNAEWTWFNSLKDNELSTFLAEMLRD